VSWKEKAVHRQVGGGGQKLQVGGHALVQGEHGKVLYPLSPGLLEHRRRGGGGGFKAHGTENDLPEGGAARLFQGLGGGGDHPHVGPFPPGVSQ